MALIYDGFPLSQCASTPQHLIQTRLIFHVDQQHGFLISGFDMMRCHAQAAKSDHLVEMGCDLLTSDGFDFGQPIGMQIQWMNADMVTQNLLFPRGALS